MVVRPRQLSAGQQHGDGGPGVQLACLLGAKSEDMAWQKSEDSSIGINSPQRRFVAP